MEFGVSALLRPKVKRHRSKFVDERLGETVFGQIDGFYVGLAGVAAFDPDVWEGFRSVDGQLGMVFLAAAGTDDAAEFPLS